MSATARIVGGAGLIAVGVVALFIPGGQGFGAYAIAAGGGIAAGGVCRRLPSRVSA